MRCSECRDRLDALVHGELTSSETAELQAHLAGCPECAADRDAQAAMSRRLKEGLVRYPAPDMLKARILGSIAQPDIGPGARFAASWQQWTKYAAAAFLIAFASSVGTAALLRDRVHSRLVSDELLASHVRSLMPGHLTDVASTDQHNVKPWFNGRVDLSPSVPRLDSLGFPLVGGRLDYISSRPVAVVVYARRQHMINVYAWPSAGDDEKESTSSVNGYHFVHWRSAGVESWAVSDLNAGELSSFVALFRRE